MDTQKTTLYEYHKSLGAKFVPFAGYEMPVQYSNSIIEEHRLTRSKAGMFDVSHMGQLSIEGKDNLVTALEKIIPTDLKNIKLNQSKYSFLTNENGGIYDDLIVTKVEKGFNVILNAACKNNDFKIIKKALENNFKLTLHKDLSLIALQGPESSQFLEKLILTELGAKIEIITPKNPNDRGCQLSLRLVNIMPNIMDKLHNVGIIADWREPDVIRIAPVPLYNTFVECYEFTRRLKTIINE